MADISKINGVPIANIEKLDAVLAANIAKVNGLVFSIAPAVSAPAAAYSVRLLDSAVGVSSYTRAAMRVRRETAGGTGDDDEADIAFDSGVISLDSAISNASAGVTATTLGQFLNVGTVNGTTYTNPDSLTVTASCFTDTWYDQSANANDATQTTNGSQPQIHLGTVNTDLILENGKPILKAVNGDSSLFTGLSGNSTAWIFSALDLHRASILISDKGTLEYFLAAEDGRLTTYINVITASNVYKNGSAVSYTSQDSVWDNLNQQPSLISADLNTSSVAEYDLGLSSSSGWSCYDMQEVIIYHTDQSSNRTGIEENINSEFLIYQPTDAPTSGLLATYTGAAVAYSVRQLSDKAVIALRIRRDSDDEETNIGWDANGDLDTTAISDFCDTANGYVTRWWDQSTNGNHADQATDASQPQIYNGTAVITENGKPALSTNGSQYLTYSTISFASDLCFVNVQTAQVSDAGYGGASGHFGSYFVGTTYMRWRFSGSSSNLIDIPAVTAGDQYTSFANRASGTMTMYYNGVTYNVSNTTNTGTATFTQLMAGNGTGALALDGNSQEIIFWAADQSSNRTGIESDINTYFSIYT